MRHMTPVDLLLVEGFKREAHDKLEIYRAANGKPLLATRRSPPRRDSVATARWQAPRCR